MVSMSSFYLTLLWLFGLCSSFPSNPPCKDCKLCPIDKPGCCYLDSESAIADGTLVSKENNTCYRKTCNNGKFQEDYFCPPGFLAIGISCYHVGSTNMTWFEAKDYCEKLDGHLAIIDTEEEATALQGNIDSHLPAEGIENATGLVWLGASYEKDAGFLWLNGNSISDGYTNFPYPYYWYHTLNCLTAFCKENDQVCYEWFHIYCYAKITPLCESACKQVMCSFQGRSYPVGSVMLRDPDCQCTWIECGEDGRPKPIKKQKPCCLYRGSVFGNGEIVEYGKCYQLKCEEGQLISYPFCPGEFEPVIYGGISSCYYISDNAMNYDEAEQYCETKGSKVAEVSSKQENEALQNYIRYDRSTERITDFWLGAQADICDDGHLGTLRWSGDLHGLPVQAVYSDFCKGYPTKQSNSRCLSMNYIPTKTGSSYCWANNPCHLKKQAICEKCATCENEHKAVCYYDNRFIKEGSVISITAVGDGLCYRKTCQNGQVKEDLDQCNYKATNLAVNRELSNGQ